MIDGDEPDLVEEGDLAQLLDDADLVATVVGEGPARDPDVLVVVVPMNAGGPTIADLALACVSFSA